MHSLELRSERFRSTRYSLEQGVVETATCGGGLLQKPGERAKKVARQAFCYFGAFYLTWIWSTITRIIQSVSGETNFGIVLLTAIFLPFQGFLNFLVYIRPRFERYREQHPDRSIWSVMRRGMCNVVMARLPRDDPDEDDYNVARNDTITYESGVLQHSNENMNVSKLDQHTRYSYDFRFQIISERSPTQCLWSHGHLA